MKRVLLRTGADTVAVIRALGGAQRKLRDAECAGLLAELKDHEGRALQENLAPFELPPNDYLVQLIYKDGGGDRTGGRLCRSGAAAAPSGQPSRREKGRNRGPFLKVAPTAR